MRNVFAALIVAVGVASEAIADIFPVQWYLRAQIQSFPDARWEIVSPPLPYVGQSHVAYDDSYSDGEYEISMGPTASFLIQSHHVSGFLETYAISNTGGITFFVSEDTTCYLSAELVAQPWAGYYVGVSFRDVTGEYFYNQSIEGSAEQDEETITLPPFQMTLRAGHSYSLTFATMLLNHSPTFETATDGFVNFSTDQPQPGPCYNLVGDIDRDGSVGLSDLALLLAHFGSSCR